MGQLERKLRSGPVWALHPTAQAADLPAGASPAARAAAAAPALLLLFHG
jgi:hypothetical protein